MNCDFCKKKIKGTNFRHVTGRIFFCYWCGCEELGDKFYDSVKFCEEFTLEFEQTYGDKKAKKSYKELKEQIEEFHKTKVLPTTRIQDAKNNSKKDSSSSSEEDACYCV